MSKLLYGVAYYDEYMPETRLEKDIEMMLAANISVVRVAESTWSTWEPQNGTFHFERLERVIDAFGEAGISVIVGTPTYAFPAWLAKEHPEVLAETHTGPERYGTRQNMDITSPAYLFYAERLIRRLMEHTAQKTCVIGFQLDNETKHYDTAGPHVQHLFVKQLKREFGDTDALNNAFGLDYWSNRIDSWEDFPDVRGTINASLGGAFARFQRELVTRFLTWQADIVRQYARPDQFVTHNFDYSWIGTSYGLQPDVDHKAAAACLDVAGCDIYHPSQDDLTGAEIAFGGDICRSLLGKNYLVLETQAQGFPEWLPYPGQLYLQAFSHVASGASMVEYWHWHSIHNSYETYWKGLLSHDFAPNPTYEEARRVGADFRRLSEKLCGLKKHNRVAMVVSNASLTALDWFPIDEGFGYNDVLRWCYDALYRLNVEVDILFPGDGERLADYDMVVAPALYAAPDDLMRKLAAYVEGGGHLVATFKTGFANEHTKVRTGKQPGLLTACVGASYSQFTRPAKVGLTGFEGEAPEAARWMELLCCDTAEVWSQYVHPVWGQYAAVTHNRYGKGEATYIGCYTTAAALEHWLERALKAAGIWGEAQAYRFPLIVRSGMSPAGNQLTFYLNYSATAQTVRHIGDAGTELVNGGSLDKGQELTLPPWGVAIAEGGK